MNRPIRVLAVFCGVLFLALLLNANYVQFVGAEDLNAQQGNRRVIDEEFSRERGPILVRGREIARSEPSDDEYDYQRVYSQTKLYAHITGFYSYLYGATDVEATANSVLSGSDSRLFVNRVVDLVGSQQPTGGSVQLTIDPEAQEAALAGLEDLPGDPRGAVVALDPTSGAVLAMVSQPTYNPNELATHDFDRAEAAYKELNRSQEERLLDRSRENIYFPGSTFKLVTAAAALESGEFRPDSQVPGGPTLQLPQTDNVLTNDVFGCDGTVTLTEALAKSCNVSFGAVGLELGNDALLEQAEAFGFNDPTVMDDLRAVPSTYPEDAEGPFVAFSAIGQYEVSATPLQMAMVAAGIANDGDVMEPYVVDEVRSPDLDVLERTEPQELSEAVSSETAEQLTQMMVTVVDQGTAAEAAIDGIEVAAKTGTAERSETLSPYAWFVSFAPADDPQVAVAVFVENANVPRSAISGGGLAGPIAKRVMEAVIGQ
ncbi:MAG: penicillin-binding protein 2 [Nocardioidaceae bacterium]|nr:penicillin-binding protein 2 [Pseudonocardiales bacterium]MBA3719925.1 penicillin-binding protein 2 [Nocardioidaceae bacterium]